MDQIEELKETTYSKAELISLRNFISKTLQDPRMSTVAGAGDVFNNGQRMIQEQNAILVERIFNSFFAKKAKEKGIVDSSELNFIL